MDRHADLLTGIDHVRNGNDAAALEAFALAAEGAAAVADRNTAVAFAAQASLRLGRPYEAIGWLDRLRLEDDASREADVLEATAWIQLGDGEQALALLEGVTETRTDDTVYPESLLQQLRCQAHHLVGDHDHAVVEALTALHDEWELPEIWRILALLADGSDVEASSAVAGVPESGIIQVLGWLLDCPPGGADRIVEEFWVRYPGDRRILALMSSLASELSLDRAVEWSTRLRAAGLGRDCAVLGLAASPHRPGPERVWAAVVAAAAFRDDRAPAVLEAATTAVEDADLAPTLRRLLGQAPDELVESFIVAAATTPRRSLLVARELLDRGAADAAVALVKHGVAQARDEAVDLRSTVAEALPGDTLERMVVELRRRGADDTAAVVGA